MIDLIIDQIDKVAQYSPVLASNIDGAIRGFTTGLAIGSADMGYCRLKEKRSRIFIDKPFGMQLTYATLLELISDVQSVLAQFPTRYHQYEHFLNDPGAILGLCAGLTFVRFVDKKLVLESQNE